MALFLLDMNVKIKKPSKKLVIIGLIFVFLAAGIAWVNWPFKEYSDTGMRPEWDASENIVNGTQNKIFTTALANMELTEFLHNEGPFTVFVPLDSSYDNLPADTKEYFANNEDPGSVRQIILYHVVKGSYTTSDFKEGMKLTTIQGEDLTLSQKDGWWVVNDYAYIEKADVVSENGVIHITTNFLLPPSISTPL